MREKRQKIGEEDKQVKNRILGIRDGRQKMQ
jgi:hypothetical protein